MAPKYDSVHILTVESIRLSIVVCRGFESRSQIIGIDQLVRSTTPMQVRILLPDDPGIAKMVMQWTSIQGEEEKLHKISLLTRQKGIWPDFLIDRDTRHSTKVLKTKGRKQAIVLLNHLTPLEGRFQMRLNFNEIDLKAAHVVERSKKKLTRICFRLNGGMLLTALIKF